MLAVSAAELNDSVGCGDGHLWSCCLGCGEQGDDGDGPAAVRAVALGDGPR